MPGVIGGGSVKLDSTGKPVQFEFLPGRTTRTRAYLRTLGEKTGPLAVASALNKMAFMWKAAIVKVVPRDEGLLASSYNVVLASPARQGDNIFSAVGSNTDYAVFIEFGTRWIAQGRVLNWSPGDPVILDWPAKNLDRTGSEGTGGEPRRDDKNFRGQTQEQAEAGGRDEFMPPMRGSFDMIQGNLQAMLRKTLADELRKAKP